MAKKPTYEELEKRVLKIEADESELKARLEVLQKSEKIYRYLFENMLHEAHIWEFVFDEYGTIKTWKLVDANPAALKSWGKSLPEIIGKNTDEIFPDSNATELFMPIVNKIYKKGVPQTWESYFPDTDQLLHMISIPFGKYFISTGFDITDSKQADEILHKSLEMLKRTEAMANIGSWEWDVQHDQVYWSEELFRIFGRHPAKGEPPFAEQSEFYVSEDFQCLRDAIETCVKQGTPYEIEVRVIRPDGEIRHCVSRGQPQYDENGKVFQIFGSFQDITDRKQTEEVLKLNYELLHIAGETAKFGGWSVDLEKNICAWSDAVADIHDVPHGYAPPVNEAINFYAPKWREKIAQCFSACAKDGIPYDEGMEIITQKGKRVWVRAIGRAVKNKKNKIIKVQGSFQDITDQKKTEEALRESEEMMRNSQSLAHICSYSTNLNADEIEKSTWVCSPEFYKIFGIDKTYPHTIEGWANFIHPDYRKAIFDYHESVVKEKTRFSREYKIIRINDGEERWVHGTGKLEFDEKGNPVRMHGAIQDITELKKADATLRESEEKFRVAFRTSPSIITLTSIENGTYFDVNDAFTKLLGYSPEEVIGESSLGLNIWADSKDRDRLVSGLKKYGIVENLEAEFIGKDGRKIDGIMSARTLDIENKKYLLAVTLDITEKKRLQKEKIKDQKIAGEQKKLALVGQVAGKMAHDFNNILGIIMGNTELSLMDCKDEETKKTLELIFEQTIRGKSLTKNLVAFAKDQEPKQDFFRISEKIDLVLNLLRKDLEGIELIKEEHPVKELLADPGMIEHALVNLIQNSIHAVSMVEHPRIISRIFPLDDKICFEIEDNGCGIPEEHLENIFEPSFTLKGSKDTTGSYGKEIKGTGYGMANVKKYIEQHKGSISVKSDFRSGTKFTVSLPVIKKELTSEEKIEIQKEKIYFDKFILLVEDEPAISGVQYRILSQEPCNHKVDIANDGQVAMDLFKRNKYDLISLDYTLPGKINGMDVYHHIRKTNKKIPILFTSGNIEFLESIKGLKQKDANIDHLSKPCQNKDYVSCINKLLGQILA